MVLPGLVQFKLQKIKMVASSQEIQGLCGVLATHSTVVTLRGAQISVLVHRGDVLISAPQKCIFPFLETTLLAFVGVPSHEETHFNLETHISVIQGFPSYIWIANNRLSCGLYNTMQILVEY